ncbi:MULTISPECIES: hypothetical protein [unclassified Polaribacter]|uniref:hypothetical protein n=1 Tax=unclassified Polaribacter TaxID=196858 RepID=UPI001CB931DF|nr:MULTISPECIES: hypothetical protein [unclassified Polaribacter]
MNKNKANRVKIAGYILKASIKLPFMSRRRDLCNPQPKQSNPKKVLLKQGNIYSSKLKFIFFDTKLINTLKYCKTKVMFKFLRLNHIYTNTTTTTTTTTTKP